MFIFLEEYFINMIPYHYFIKILLLLLGYALTNYQITVLAEVLPIVTNKLLLLMTLRNGRIFF